MARHRNLMNLLDDLAPGVQQAFLQSISNIQSDAQLNLIITALNDGDIDRALRLLNISAAYFAPLDRALADAYQQGGDWAIEGIKQIARSQGATVVVRFDGRNLRAEEILKQRSSRLIAEITQDQIETVRTVLTQNMANGVSPRKAALNIVGRINRETGRREGGALGLTSQESQYADRALAQLTSGDPAQMREYLNRSARDRRFDSAIVRAIDDGKPVSASDAERITNRYRDILLRKRGERIARTELLGSLHAAQSEGTQQLIDSGQITPDQVSEEWDAANDEDTRESHANADGQVKGQDGTFSIGGYRMRYPGDSSLGAPASEIINCRCRVRQNFDFIAGLNR